MKHTVTALYETRAQAEQVEAALVAANLVDHVEISDETGAGSEHHDFKHWLSKLMGGHDDRHVYIEGVRRGHYMLSAKVDALSETRAAEILDAATPVDLVSAQETWRAEGWSPSEVAGEPISTATGSPDLNAKAPTSAPNVKSVGVRIYPPVEDMIIN